MQEIRGEVSRVVSDQDVQKKYLLKEISRVEGIAQSALENSSGVQQQVDSMAQQTRDIHDSLTAMNRHSTELTSSLKSMMEGFKNLNFELPNKFDSWLKVRIGNEGPFPSTISGEALRMPPTHPIPLTPPLILANVPTPPAPATNVLGQSRSEVDAEGETSSTRPASPATSRPSSASLYQQYLNNHSSQEDLVADMGATSEDATKVGVEGMESDTVWTGLSERAVVTEQPMDVDERQEGEEQKDEEVVSVANSIPPAEDVGRDIEEDQPGGPEQSVQDMEDVLAGPPPDGQSPDPDQLSPSASVPPPCTLPSIDAPPASPISPDIIRSHSVEPPLGLLAPAFHLSPASSLATIPSPTSNNHADYLTSQVHSGPITRSRTRSRSPTGHPAAGKNQTAEPSRVRPRSKH